jgi:hypothetical protein
MNPKDLKPIYCQVCLSQGYQKIICQLTPVHNQVLITTFQKEYAQNQAYREDLILLGDNGAVLCNAHQNCGYMVNAGTPYAKIITDVKWDWFNLQGTV